MNDKLKLEDILKISIVHNGPTVTTDPNGLAVMAMIPDVMCQLLKPHKNLVSAITDRPPALTYIDTDGAVTLTPAELMRLAGLRLTAVEYFALRKQFGIRHQWHEDFYDPETGYALQPRNPLPTLKGPSGSTEPS